MRTRVYLLYYYYISLVLLSNCYRFIQISRLIKSTWINECFNIIQFILKYIKLIKLPPDFEWEKNEQT